MTRKLRSAAILPAELRDQAPRRLREMRSGDTCHILFTDMRVDPRGNCFVEARAELRKADFMCIEVRRDKKGFHVTVPAKHKYRPQRIGWIWRLGLIPVATVTVSDSKG